MQHTCHNHPDRPAKRRDDREALCLSCWQERHTQGAITRDVALIKRAAGLDTHERLILLRRAENSK